MKNSRVKLTKNFLPKNSVMSLFIKKNENGNNFNKTFILEVQNGKNLQGINTPIGVNVRSGRGGIGAYGREKKTTENEIYATQIGDLETDKNEKSERTSLWRKKGLESNKKIHYYVYKSVESKKQRQKTEISECSKVMVIYMTGPEQRILSGYHAIAGKIRKDKKFSNFSMPELQHNLNLLIDVSEQAIIEMIVN
ncbi:hypothetical protein PGB90_000956 [Kerria lacca]